MIRESTSSHNYIVPNKYLYRECKVENKTDKTTIRINLSKIKEDDEINLVKRFNVSDIKYIHLFEIKNKNGIYERDYSVELYSGGSWGYDVRDWTTMKGKDPKGYISCEIITAKEFINLKGFKNNVDIIRFNNIHGFGDNFTKITSKKIIFVDNIDYITLDKANNSTIIQLKKYRNIEEIYRRVHVNGYFLNEEYKTLYKNLNIKILNID